jgi:hypothetical protein
MAVGPFVGEIVEGGCCGPDQCRQPDRGLRRPGERSADPPPQVVRCDDVELDLQGDPDRADDEPMSNVESPWPWCPQLAITTSHAPMHQRHAHQLAQELAQRRANLRTPEQGLLSPRDTPPEQSQNRTVSGRMA